MASAAPRPTASRRRAPLAWSGYTVIIYTARGFGASGGLIHWTIRRTRGDARKLIDLAASRPEVAKDGNDPVIGFAGASYGGAGVILGRRLIPASMR